MTERLLGIYLPLRGQFRQLSVSSPMLFLAAKPAPEPNRTHAGGLEEKRGGGGTDRLPKSRDRTMGRPTLALFLVLEEFITGR